MEEDDLMRDEVLFGEAITYDHGYIAYSDCAVRDFTLSMDMYDTSIGWC